MGVRCARTPARELSVDQFTAEEHAIVIKQPLFVLEIAGH